MAASFLIVYTHGQPQPCNRTSEQACYLCTDIKRATCSHEKTCPMCPRTQGMITGFEVGRPVAGEVTVGLFLGDHKREWDAPAVAYAFNASFVQAGVIRLNAGHLDFPGLLPAFGSAGEVLHIRPLLGKCMVSSSPLLAGASVDPFAIDAAGFFMDLLFDELAADESAPLR